MHPSQLRRTIGPRFHLAEPSSTRASWFAFIDLGHVWRVHLGLREATLATTAMLKDRSQLKNLRA